MTPTLTHRELQVVRGIAAGLSTREIGVELGLSEHTVKATITRVSRRLKAAGRVEVVVAAIRAGWLPEFLPPGYAPPDPVGPPPFFNGVFRFCAQHPAEHVCVECWDVASDRAA